jgi:hypothetical protein
MDKEPSWSVVCQWSDSSGAGNKFDECKQIRAIQEQAVPRDEQRQWLSGHSQGVQITGGRAVGAQERGLGACFEDAKGSERTGTIIMKGREAVLRTPNAEKGRKGVEVSKKSDWTASCVEVGG